MRYRNSEGYADPTAGAALAHISNEERRKKKKNKQRCYHSVPYNKEIEKKLRKERRINDARQQHSHERTTYWVQMWPKDKAGTLYIEREMENR